MAEEGNELEDLSLVSSQPQAADERKKARWQRLKRGTKWVAMVLALTGAALLGVHDYARRTGKPSPVASTVRFIEQRVIAPVFYPPDLFFEGASRRNILIIGTDVNIDRRRRILKTNARADSILLLSVDRAYNKAYLLSIPRDTIARLSGESFKINAAHTFGGVKLLRETVSEQFCVQVDHYVKFSFDAFKKVIELIGGVDLEVEYDMHYDDDWGNLHVHLRPGWRHLDAEQAHGYVRHRKNDYRRYCPKCKCKIEKVDPTGDIGRTQRQQKLIAAVLKKVMNGTMLLKLPKIIEEAYKHVETDLTSRQLLALASFARSLNSEDIVTATVPGYIRGGFWVPQREDTRLLMRQMFDYTFADSLWEAKRAEVESGIARYAYRTRHLSKKASKKLPAPPKKVEDEPLEEVLFEVPEEGVEITSQDSGEPVPAGDKEMKGEDSTPQSPMSETPNGIAPSPPSPPSEQKQNPPKPSEALSTQHG